MRSLNQSGIKVIFIINRDQPRDNGRPNTTKQTLIAHLRSLGFNNLIKNEGDNILEVDLINGVEGRTNEIFRYIYNDFTLNNNFNNANINEINNLPERQLFHHLNNNYELFSRIHSVDDLITRGKRRANKIIGLTIPLIIAAGFSPIPFIDIPIFILLIALMLIKIFKAYGFNINIQIFENFFNNYFGVNNNRNNNIINNEEITLGIRIINWLSQNFENIHDDNTQFIIQQLIRAFYVRIGVTAFLGLFDFIPVFGFLIAGGINAIINSKFLYDIRRKAEKFLADKIRRSGGRQSILNIFEGYNDSISLIYALRNKNEWTRKIQILNC